MNVIQLRALRAEERFRDQLATARAILRSLIDSEITDDVVQGAEDLAEDIFKAAEELRSERR
jgi:hypothetical protein